MSNRRAAGFTLIEMVIAIVVIAVGLAGVLSAFNRVVASSADPLVHKQMLAIAEEMMEEILLKDFSGTAAPVNGCVDRSNATLVSDYAGFAMNGICDPTGTAINGLAGYNVAVAVADGGLGLGVGNAFTVTVSVTHGAETLTLTGWRTRY